MRPTLGVTGGNNYQTVPSQNTGSMSGTAPSGSNASPDPALIQAETTPLIHQGTGKTQQSWLSRKVRHFMGKDKASDIVTTDTKGKAPEKPAASKGYMKLHKTESGRNAAPPASLAAGPTSAQIPALPQEQFMQELDAVLGRDDLSREDKKELVADLLARTPKLKLEFSKIRPDDMRNLLAESFNIFARAEPVMLLEELSLDLSGVQKPDEHIHGDVDRHDYGTLSKESMCSLLSCLDLVSCKYNEGIKDLALRNNHLGLSDPDPFLISDIGLHRAATVMDGGSNHADPKYTAISGAEVFPVIDSSDPKQSRLIEFNKMLMKHPKMARLDLRDNMVPDGKAMRYEFGEHCPGFDILGPGLKKSDLQNLRIDLRTSGAERKWNGMNTGKALKSLIPNLPKTLVELEVQQNGLAKKHLPLLERLPKSLQILHLGDMTNRPEDARKIVEGLKKARPNLKVYFSLEGQSAQSSAPAHT